ncbi:MAG TPA: hypothetical protein VN238_18085 [Solirubrobacteraceae bacterium]|nr:hypothetical protein [Solirubrobacteraceae bacterium]
MLGYDRVATSIAMALRESDDIVLLEGPPGVGKSWLARGIGSLWQRGGGSSIVAQGDVQRGEVDFYPLGFAMASTAGWRAGATGFADSAKAAESLVGTAGIVTSTVTALAKMRRSRRRARSLYLGEAEQPILFHLQRLGRKRPLLLIADNLHWWDAASLAFLRRLREPAMAEAFPFLSGLRVLGVATPEPYQRVVQPDAFGAMLHPGSTRRFPLDRIARGQFEEVLVALGAPPAAAQRHAQEIYTCSGGNLALARRCAQRAEAGDTDLFGPNSAEDDFVTRLLTERIKSLGELGEQAVALLQVAAVVGLTFRRDEVACAVESDESHASRLLRYCRDEDVLELTEGIGRFVHDVYRRHFLAEADDRPAIHERLGRCLQRLRPGEYELRCLNAIGAEQPRQAGSLAVQGALQRAREGRAWREQPRDVVQAMNEAGFSQTAEKLITALEQLKEYRFRECLVTLDTLPRDLTPSLLAESDYLRAMCLMSTRSEEDRAQGRAVLEAWDGLWDDEPELGIRLAQLLLYGMTHFLDKEPGRRLEGRLRRMLVERVSFDEAARDALYTLDRSSGSLHPPDVAVVRNREAVEHFGGNDDDTVVRRPVELYRCLVNLGASQICVGRYGEAVNTYEQADRLIDAYPVGVFPRTEYPRMNRVLAEYRRGGLTAQQAVERQREIGAATVASDPFYVENALAVYLTLSGRSEDALEILDRLDAELRRGRTAPEPSMQYLIGANRAAVRFVAGDTRTARAEWDNLTDTVARIAYVIRPILVRRHALLRDVLAGGPLPAREFDEVLLGDEGLEFGPLWDNYGRGFRMPEVEFWREN